MRTRPSLAICSRHARQSSARTAHVKKTLASFKAPKRVLRVDTIGRAANGKVDYKRLTAEAESRVDS